MIRRIVAVASLLSIAWSGAVGATVPGTAPASTTDGIHWAPCTDPDARDAELRCATLTVPLNYDNPAGTTIDIALVKAPAQGPRRGAVLFNPGGPGGSGFLPIARNGTYLQRQLGLEDFDLIGFDPRGVDRSGGLQCVDGAFLDAHLYLDDTPDTPAERAALVGSDAEFAAACRSRYGDTLRFYSTANTARDMDAIRAALGDQKISYLGISYGTYLGAVYATLFPDRVAAMVLDSAYEPNGDTAEQGVLTQLVGFEGAFDNWVAYCQRDATCRFHTTDVTQRWLAMRDRLDAMPLQVGNREVNQVVFERATIAALYSPSEWPALAQALAAADTGDGAPLLALADSYSQRKPDGTYASIRQLNPIISCASGFETPVPDDLPALLATIHAKAPVFGGRLTLDDLRRDLAPDCPALVGPAEQVEVRYRGDAPIVVVGGINDPATPFRWATELDAAMGPSSRLVTFTGEGHGQLLGSTCITAIERAVLSSGSLPADGKVCDPDPVVQRPEWWQALPTPARFGRVTDLAALAGALGLSDTEAYWEARLTTMTPDEAIEAYRGSFAGSGWRLTGQPDLGIPGTAAAAFVDSGGNMVLVVALGPDAFGGDLAGTNTGIPAGQTAVILAWFADLA